VINAQVLSFSVLESSIAFVTYPFPSVNFARALHGSCLTVIAENLRQMGLIFVPLLLATLLSQQADAAYLQKPSATSSAPAFAWGPVPVLKTGVSDEASRVIYEVG